MNWIQTYAGLAFDLDVPKPEQVTIEDIAHALSNICRYNGHCTWHYSVAQHSIYVAQLVAATDPLLAMTALLHDSSEAYHGDFSSPLKALWRRVAPDALKVERWVEEAVGDRFGVSLYPTPRIVKQADLIMLATEKAALFGPSPRPAWHASSGYDPAPACDTKIEFMRPETAKRLFLEAFETYGGHL